MKSFKIKKIALATALVAGGLSLTARATNLITTLHLSGPASFGAGQSITTVLPTYGMSFYTNNFTITAGHDYALSFTLNTSIIDSSSGQNITIAGLPPYFIASGQTVNSLASGNHSYSLTSANLTNFVGASKYLNFMLSNYNGGSGSAFTISNILFEDVTGASTPSSSVTLYDLNPNAYALRGAYSLQSAIINTGLNYDCTTFDERGICLSAGGRVTDTVNPSTNSQGALVIASYRANDNWRIGGYLDQNLSTNDARGVNLDNSNPMGGVFAVWNQNTDGTGYQVRVAAGYSDKDVTITRNSGLNTEAGTGESSLRTQAYSATVSRGFQINDTRWIASPYLGVRYTKIKRAGYTEDDTVDSPLTYSALSQETTTALAGVRFNGQFGDKVNVLASAGVESDIAHNTGDYAATGVSGLTPIAFNENIRHVRPVAQAGVRYAIDKRQTVGANLNYRQEAFNSTHSVTGMVNYELGF